MRLWISDIKICLSSTGKSDVSIMRLLSDYRFGTNYLEQHLTLCHHCFRYPIKQLKNNMPTEQGQNRRLLHKKVKTAKKPGKKIPAKCSQKIITSKIKEDVKELIAYTENKRASAKEKNINARYEDLVIFIHGYNNNDDDVEKRLDLMDEKLGTNDIITTSFNWHSAHKMSAYKIDQKNADNLSHYFLRHYLKEIVDKGIFERIHVSAHSMGNYILCKSILQLKEDKVPVEYLKDLNFVCFAADVEKAEYKNAVKVAQSANARSWTHFWSARDRALEISNVANNGITWFVKENRAGLQKCEEDDDFFKAIDCTKIFNEGGLNGHGYIMDEKYWKMVKDTLEIGIEE